MKTRRMTVIAWIICIPLMALEILGLYLSKKLDSRSLIESLVVFILVFAVMALLQRKGGEKIEKDERTIRLASRAQGYSWMITFLFTEAIMYLQYIEVIDLSSSQALSLVVMVMAFSFLGANFILKRKGDVD
jgi:uncharacterized membrane protein YfcA